MIDAIALGADSVTTIDEFKAWTRAAVRPIFPHGAHISGHGHIHSAGVGLDYLVAVDYPLDYLLKVRNRAGGIDSPIMSRWMATRQPVLFEADDPWHDVPAEWLKGFREYDMRNAVAHGVYDTQRCVGTFQYFCRIPGRLGDFHAETVRQLAPIVHETLCRVITQLNTNNAFSTRLAELSAREREITQWLRIGKSNGEIASISGLSENTVKHHLTRIFRKLEVETRGQLLYRLAEHEVRLAPGYGMKIL